MFACRLGQSTPPSGLLAKQFELQEARLAVCNVGYSPAIFMACNLYPWATWNYHSPVDVAAA